LAGEGRADRAEVTADVTDVLPHVDRVIRVEEKD